MMKQMLFLIDKFYLLGIPLLLSLAHYLGMRWDLHSKTRIHLLRSLTAGFSVGYVFLILLPEVNLLGTQLAVDPMVLVLAGFVFFHVAHKFIFLTRDKPHKVLLLDEIHIFTAGLYNFLITFSMVELITRNFFKGMIVFMLMLVHTVLVEISHAETSRQSEHAKMVSLIIATFLGGMLAILGITNLSVTTFLFAVTVGAIIYIAIREEIPRDSATNPIYFILGSSIFILYYFAVTAMAV